MADAIRILGIDPGSRITGFGLIEIAGSVTRPIEWGVVRTEGDHFERLRTIFERLGVVVARTQPAELAIERVFLHRNADSALKLGQARAAALCATFTTQLPTYEYAARQVKKAVTGNGAADKEQVQQMVRLVLGVSGKLEADAADALAIAVCHAQCRAAAGLVSRAVSGAGG